ncbi:hypothetical protein HYPSUDRAFT_913356 [Hypholoma sublateritium FD-334 SS-4]|uniref:Actin-like ATPase domain-containing protein n=1 Tax=Hypholoma sublateritium (strain FD-334 SS-4) TaxID=945553 RepID=A0A0D2KWB5_HYPSF|nr:hypothetical protein HYPSUDRAFT_913356 [Hypholoma sublateritium FD-334 SS-4]
MPLLTRRKNVEPKLVVAIDIGTTYSAVSYCIITSQDRLQETYNFQEVNRWPGQITADAKIPSVLFYDQEGKCRLGGAEIEDLTLLFDAEEEGWEKAEWWKLLLRPEQLSVPNEISPLPYGISVDKVLENFLAYIKSNLQQFIVNAQVKGQTTWNSLSPSMDVILTIPNGWDGKVQHRMRNAAIHAQLVSPDGGKRVRFLSEGEAAIHYCLDYAKISDQVSVGNIVIVCDTGGGTTDIGIYRVKNLSPTSLEEIASPSCLIAGGVFVDTAAKIYITEQLKGSEWDTPECLAKSFTVFERLVKRQFQGSENAMFLPLHGSRRTDDTRGIMRGQLMIPRDKMASFFETSLDRIKHGLMDVLGRDFGSSVNNILLVGGFAESRYAFTKITEWASKFTELDISKPDHVLSKAIPHGALSWYTRSAVQTKIAKFHYGAETDVEFDENDPDMVGRRVYKNILGERRVRGGWESIVKKDAKILATDEHSKSFHQDVQEHGSMNIEMELYAYRWAAPPSFFSNSDGTTKEGFIYLGTVTADLTQCFNAGAFQTSPTGKKYKRLQYEMCLSFAEIEIQARLKWKEKNAVKFGQATIVYDI